MLGFRGFVNTDNPKFKRSKVDGTSKNRQASTEDCRFLLVTYSLFTLHYKGHPFGCPFPLEKSGNGQIERWKCRCPVDTCWTPARRVPHLDLLSEGQQMRQIWPVPPKIPNATAFGILKANRQWQKQSPCGKTKVML